MMTLSFPINMSQIYHGQHVVPSFLTSLFSQQSGSMIVLNLNPTFILNVFPQTVGSFPHLKCWFHHFGTHYVRLIWELLALFQRIRTIVGVAAVKLCSGHFWPRVHMPFHGGEWIPVSQMFPLIYFKSLPWVSFPFLPFIADTDSLLAKKDILLKPQIDMSLTPDKKKKQ